MFELTDKWQVISKSGVDVSASWRWVPEIGLTAWDVQQFRVMEREGRIFMAQRKVGNEYHLVVKLNPYFQEVSEKRNFMKNSTSVTVQRLYNN